MLDAKVLANLMQQYVTAAFPEAELVGVENQNRFYLAISKAIVDHFHTQGQAVIADPSINGEVHLPGQIL